MDDIKKGNLLKQKENIIKDLQVDHVLDDLYSLQVLTREDLEKIRNETVQREAAKCLLDIVIKKDNKAYDHFANVLQKDYDWLFKVLQIANDGNQYDQLEREAFQDTLVLGDVPRRPPHYVHRTEPLQDLRTKLEELEPCQRIVLHGMTGSGKSCLAAAAVKDSLLLQSYFHNRVFWVNLGEVKEVDQLPAHMYLLIERLKNDSREQTKIRPTSVVVGQESDIFIEVQKLKDELKRMFCSGSYRHALLVLDNIILKEATEAFDVGCKTLITTQLKDIVTGNNTVYLNIKGGFAERETLLLFANALKTEIKKLPNQAIKIHNLCKGEPILIALIGSLLEPYKEDLLNTTGRWDYYIKKLTKKDYNLKSQLFDAISICIEGLGEELKELYNCFAVFVEDINITSQVMQTVWRMEDKFAVESKMTELENKSLIVSYYNKDLKTYVYGIHDLFLAYLKQKLGPVKIIELHRKLISAYKHICNNNFAQLPNDNYIFQYIGYHLKESQLFDEFSIYFDLTFIGAKIKAIGIADLLRDFQFYREYITYHDDTLKEKLDEYINFVKVKGHDLYKYQDTDIIQCGLGQNKDSHIYKAALAIARDSPKRLYLQLQAPQEQVYFTHTLDLKYDVSAARFTSDPNKVLVGMENGNITLWEQAYHQKLYVFSGHNDSIIYLQLQPDANGFLSVSSDGCVKIWSLEGLISPTNSDNIYDENGFSKDAPSPRIKQANWTNFYENGGRLDRSKTCEVQNSDDKITSASFANETENRIVTGCFSGRIIIWDTTSEDPSVVLDLPGHGFVVNCITFSVDDNLIIFSCGTNIFLYNAKDGEFLSQFCNNMHIRSLLIVPELGTTLVAVNDNTISMWTWNQINLKISDPAMTILNKQEQANFLCGAITLDGMYLVAGSTDHFIRIWKLNTGKIVQEILNNKGLVVCLDTFCDDTKNAVHILLSGADDKTVKQWNIQPMQNIEASAKLLPIFDCYWNNNSSVPRIAVVDSKNKIQVMSGHSLIIESEQMRSPIKCVRFSLCGNKIAVGLENGDIMEFDYKNRNYEHLMKLHDSVVLLKYFSTSKNSCHQNATNNDVTETAILVATAQNGWVTVYQNGRARCLVQPPPSNISLKQVYIVPIVQCFYIKAANKLVSVSQNRTIKVWNIEDGSYSIKEGDKIKHNDVSNCVVTMAVLSKDQSLIAITMTDGCFEIYSLHVDNYEIYLTLNYGKCLENPLRSCRFSSTGKILAIGQDNGDIVIWSVESRVTLGVLKLHKSWVRYLLFSPVPGLILISVGEQIAWWDLTKLPNENQQTSKNYRRRSNSAKMKHLTLDVVPPTTNFNLGVWNDKEGRSDKPHLLSAIKLRGLHSTYISASSNFTAFFTIDNNGYLYIMEVLKQRYF